MDLGLGLMAIGAGIAVLTGFGAGMGQGNAARGACEAVGKNPEAEGKIRTMFIITTAIAETTALYGLLISFIILFVKWGG